METGDGKPWLEGRASLRHWSKGEKNREFPAQHREQVLRTINYELSLHVLSSSQTAKEPSLQ